MNDRNLELVKLNELIESVREYYAKPGFYDLDKLVSQRICPELGRLVSKICIEIDSTHEIINPKTDKRIIHYTEIAVLVSILQTACNETAYLRMYDSAHSNDPEEGSFLSKHLQQQYKWLKVNDIRHAYIASFVYESDSSNANDNLPFWRTYGREGEGCALSMMPPREGLRSVCYGSAGVKPTIAKLNPILKLLNPLLNIAKPALLERIKEVLSKTIWENLERINYLYKDNAYRYENECRFIVLESDLSHKKEKIHLELRNVRESPPTLRHYFEHKDLDIKMLFLSNSSITLGPCVAYRDDVRYCIEILRERAELKYSTEIRISEIPYRKP